MAGLLGGVTVAHISLRLILRGTAIAMMTTTTATTVTPLVVFFLSATIAAAGTTNTIGVYTIAAAGGEGVTILMNAAVSPLGTIATGVDVAATIETGGRAILGVRMRVRALQVTAAKTRDLRGMGLGCVPTAVEAGAMGDSVLQQLLGFTSIHRAVCCVLTYDGFVDAALAERIERTTAFTDVQLSR